MSVADGGRSKLARELRRELHDLSQPLTALQGYLELGQMIGDCEALRNAVDGGLAETQRSFAAIARMRELLTRKAEEETDGDGE